MADREYLQRLADERYTGELRNAILEAIEDIADSARLSDIAERIQAGDVDSAIAAAAVSAQAFEKVREAELRAARAAGAATAKEVGLRIQFDREHERVRQAIDGLHTALIREVTEETRAAIRDEIEDGMRRGVNPRDTARRIRGTYDRDKGRHVGGVIGLTRHQASVVRRAREELESGDPEQMRRYLGRKLRDRRHDRTIIKAIREGKALTQSQIEAMSSAYRRRWTQHRAETIGRDQALEALTQGQELAIDQALDENAVDEGQLVKQWVVPRDGREREDHAAIPGMNQGGVPRGEHFDTPAGPMKRPRDRGSPGGTPENTINCRCTTTYVVRRQ